MKDINATVIVDLIPEESEIYNNLPRDAKRGIKKAINDKLVVEPSNNDDEWKEFYHIYKNTIISGGSNFESLEELKKNTHIFFTCKKDGKIIAGAGIFFKELYNFKIPRLYFNASLKEYQDSYPNNLLYWNCIIWSKKNRYKEFDLGGWQINARDHLRGVNEFKEKWGKIVYYKKDYQFLRAIGRKLIRSSGFFWWLNKKLRGRT